MAGSPSDVATLLGLIIVYATQNLMPHYIRYRDDCETGARGVNTARISVDFIVH